MPDSLLCKFFVSEATDYYVNQEGERQRKVTLRPVLAGSEENKSFSKYTPAGVIELMVTTEFAADYLEPGGEFYVELRKAD